MSTLSAPPLAPGRSNRRSGAARPGARLLIAIGLAAAVLLVLAGPPAGAAPAQVPGSTATTAPVTATTAVTTESSTSSTRVADENRRVWLVVGALVGVAVLLLILTIVYWRQTDPARHVARRAALHRLPVDEPIAVTPPASRIDEDPDVLAEPDGADAADDADDAVDTGELPVADPRAEDATHHGVGSDWEPRATGEQPQIVVPVAARTTRPTRDQRALVLGLAGAADADPDA